MGLVGAEVRMPLGEPWRVGRRPYGKDALSSAASCLKGFYLDQAVLGVNAELGRQLDLARLPSRADRNRALLGHAQTSLPANPLAPRRVRRRHPKMLAEDARGRLLEVVSSARDRLVVTWLADGGFRIGELCGLHLSELHLREQAPCREARAAHAHVCHRDENPNRSRAKSKYPWDVRDGVVTPAGVRASGAWSPINSGTRSPLPVGRVGRQPPHRPGCRGLGLGCHGGHCLRARRHPRSCVRGPLVKVWEGR